jgi:N-acyl-phosphatidylethanolamine-hydrolysing phospholipase D
VKPSHHRPGGGFRNPWDTWEPRTAADFRRWQKERRSQPAPAAGPIEIETVASAIAMPFAGPAEARITWVGHASFLIQIGRFNVLTDPVWGARASPVSWAGPGRIVPPAIDFSALPPIHSVILSHDHYDHLDSGTVRRLARTWPGIHWICPLGYERWLRRRGVDRVSELDWWQDDAVDVDGETLHVTAFPVQHWTRRSPFVKDSKRLWASFGLESGGHRVYFAGDSGWCPAFAEIGSRAGPFDALLLPIGAYEPRWFMKPAHMNPEEAVQAWIDLGRSGRLVPMHWGTFRLTDEPVLEPPVRLRRAWQAAGCQADDLSILRHGETLILTRNGDSTTS